MNELQIKKSGYAAIVGRPNVGKSTLLNCLIGEKISIVSPKPQTTRCQILGIKTLADIQIVYIDTPGIHQEEKHTINRYMNRVASSVISESDVIIFMIDATTLWRQEDELVLKKLQQLNHPVILVLNKIDLLRDKSSLLPLIEQLNNRFSFVDIIPISARDTDNVSLLEQQITTYLPAGDILFPPEQITDKSARFHIAEVIREKIIQETEQELPYITAIEIEQFKQTDKLMEIGAVIWVERQGQKIIIIGKNGARLKKIGTVARSEIEKWIGQKIFLRLWVKVKTNWTDDDRALKSLGYE
jgi:GTP-binding protein Era